MRIYFLMMIVLVSILPLLSVFHPILRCNSGEAVTVGAGKTMIIDVLQIGDL